MFPVTISPSAANSRWETGKKMSSEELIELQKSIGLSDRKMALSLGVTRQTWRNWRTGRACPVFVQNALRWMMAVRTLDPSNDNLPESIRVQTNG